MRLCVGGALLTGTQDPEEYQKELKKKQKNRVAAQRSRQKHTDKADALHQQHESLEKHNHTLRKEIQALQAELMWWSRTLHLHESRCPMKCSPCPVPLPTPCRGQAEWLQGQPVPYGQHNCQEHPGLVQNPGSSSPVQQFSPGPQGHDCPGFLSPLPSLPLGSAVVTLPPAQLCSSLVLSALHTGSSLLGHSSKLSAHLPSPPTQGLEHPTKEKLGSSPDNLSAAPGPACPQSWAHKPAFSLSAEWQTLAEDSGPHLPLAFPLLSSAQVHF
ncbi:basic leucine zipper transcriptional factor ATF-like 2 isoform X3 [Castor canadensis]|uniref:basic leucine zipper transcriptional factor ATF-like 2 isoform X3 n=1 Tax=Castor canadensis TaxID=51338 RepID=UPI003D1646E9